MRRSRAFMREKPKCWSPQRSLLIYKLKNNHKFILNTCIVWNNLNLNKQSLKTLNETDPWKTEIRNILKIISENRHENIDHPLAQFKVWLKYKLKPFLHNEIFIILKIGLKAMWRLEASPRAWALKNAFHEFPIYTFVFIWII